MKFYKNLKLYFVLTIIVLISIILILNKFALYGVILLSVAGIIYALWELVIRNKEEKIDELEGMLGKTSKLINSLQEENKELRTRKLNISEIKNILDVGMLQVNTTFTRTWNDKFEKGNKSLHFIGALEVKIIARYGIDLKELRIKFNEERNEVIVANLTPKFLSFNDFDYDWKIAEVMEYRIPWFGAGQWRKSAELEGLAGQIKEELRTKTHQEVKNGPQELEWVLHPLKKQIASTVRILLGSPYRTVRIAENFDDTFIPIEEFTEIKAISQ